MRRVLRRAKIKDKDLGELESDFKSQWVSSAKRRLVDSAKMQKELPSAGGWRPNLSINNLEQEKKREVEREIKEKNKLRRRRKNTRTILKLALFGLLFLAVYFGLCWGSKRMIYSDSLGGESAYSSQMREVAQNAVRGGFLGNVKPSFGRYQKIEKGIMGQHPEVDGVAVKFNFWKMATEVKLKIEVPIISWQISAGRTAYVNEKGEVFEPPASLVALFKPLEIAGTGLGATTDDSLPVNSDKLRWIVAVVPEIRNAGIEASKVNVAGESLKSVEVELSSGVRLIFSTEEDPVRSGVAAAKSVKYLERTRQGGLGGLSYIDVSNPDRVVYK